MLASVFKFLLVALCAAQSNGIEVTQRVILKFFCPAVDLDPMG